MRRVVPIVVVGLAVCAACRTPDPAPQRTELVESGAPDVPTALADADRALREHLRITQLGVVPAQAQQRAEVLRALIRWKTNHGREATAPFEAALTRDADPDVAEFALIRLAILYLNLGCEVSRLETPSHLSDDQRGIFGDMLDDTAMRVIERTQQYLQSAAQLDGRRGDLVKRLRAELPDDAAEVQPACRATRTAWSAPDEVTIDQLAAAACADGEGPLCWVSATWGSGGTPALEEACRLDMPDACVELADRKVVFSRPQSNPADAADAERLYAKACELGYVDGCRKHVAVYVPGRVEDYENACLTASNAVACTKLARVAALQRPDRPTWYACTSEDARPSPENVGALCEQGDPFACVSRAGSLAVDAAYILRLDVPAAPDPLAAALECGEGEDHDCRAAARAFAQAGDWGCATTMLLEACSRGTTELCGFYHGN